MSVTPDNSGPRFSRRHALAALAVGLVAPGALASCSRDSGGREEAAPAKPNLTLEPSDGSADVLPGASVRAEVRNGWFQQVALTNPDGKVVQGTLSHDRTTFSTSEPLGYDKTYTWSGSVVGGDGVDRKSVV